MEFSNEFHFKVNFFHSRKCTCLELIKFVKRNKRIACAQLLSTMYAKSIILVIFFYVLYKVYEQISYKFLREIKVRLDSEKSHHNAGSETPF